MVTAKATAGRMSVAALWALGRPSSQVSLRMEGRPDARDGDVPAARGGVNGAATLIAAARRSGAGGPGPAAGSRTGPTAAGSRGGTFAGTWI